MPVATQQPTLTLKFGLMTQGVFPPRDAGDGATLTIGHFRMFGFDFVPSRGVAETGGQNISIAQNTALFAILGTTYGGNGQTTFGIPDLGGRVAVSQGQSPGLSFYDLGQIGGVDAVTLTQANLPVSRGGSSVGIDTTEESLTINYVINPFGIFPTESSGGLGMVGQINAFAGNFEPNNMLFCDGRLLPISEYDALFAVIGTTYGGDGVTTFGLPDLRGRAPVGTGNGVVLGEVLGSETVTLTTANLPGAMGGSGTPVSNYGPSLGITYLVATQGVFPSRDGGVTFDAGDPPMVGEIIMFAGSVIPRGFAQAAGQLLPIDQNQALFALYGTTYGGDGVTTFALPDLRGRAAADDTFFQPVGTMLGVASTTLLIADFPALSLNGDGGSNSFFGANQADTINGNGGDDSLTGNGGNDILNGGTGNDQMNGGTGNDIYIVDSTDDTVSEVGGDGIDRVEASSSGFVLPTNVENLEYTGAGAFAGTGNDLANIVTGGSQGDTLSGGAGDDNLGGEAGDDVLNGDAGNDRLVGGPGADTMNGGADNDTLVVDNAGDIANGDAGTDTVQITSAITYTISSTVENVSNLSGGAVTATLNDLANTYGGGAAADTVFGQAGDDMLYGRGGDDLLLGGDNNDRLFGDVGQDSLNGQSGNDMLYGGADTDQLLGGSGNDTLYGEAGSDSIDGGSGVDQLYGGAGGDVFTFNNGDSGATLANADFIRDYSRAQGDFISLERIDAIAGGGNDAFSFIGTAAFSNVAGQLRYEVVGGETRVLGDIDGNGVADVVIRIVGVHTLTTADFTL